MVHPFTRQPSTSVLVAAVLLALTAWPRGASAADKALPVGPQLVHGQASFTNHGQTLTVTTSRNSAIDWQSFSIGAQASVRFEQPDAASQVLNRVLGRDASHIYGRLSSNGEVWLLNPYGVLFGRGAVVDVSGLIASSLDMRAADWAAGQRVLRAVPGVMANPVENFGTLRSSTGGRILLLGSGNVNNAGTIDASAGNTTLGSAAQWDLADDARPDIAVRLQTSAGSASNSGRISANGGTIDLLAAMVNQSGVLRADSVAAGPGGSVRLQARDAMSLEPGSTTSATGPSAGGRVILIGGTQLVEGRIDAGSSQGVGGDIVLAAPRIALLDGAAVHADGAQGGGTVRIGQTLTLAGINEPAAQAVFMGRQSFVSADATTRGEGGSLWLWGGGSARVYGSLSARGGPAGGNGGFVETSALGLVAELARVDTQAPQGRVGNWLLDPLDIQIVSAATGNVSQGPDFSPTGTGARISVTTLASALNNSDVTISTDVAGADRGVISMNDTVLNWPAGQQQGAGLERTLTLKANAGISLLSANIISTSDRLNLRLLAGEGPNHSITLTNSSISVGGELTLRGTSFDAGTSTLLAQRIDLQANRVNFGALRNLPGVGLQPILTSTATGDALVIRGLVDSVEGFSSEAGVNALSTANNNSRWLIYARDPTTTSPAILDFGFKQYGANYPAAAAQGTGNGLLYATRPVLTVAANGVALDKVYDRGTQLGLATQQLSSLALTGFVGNDSPQPGATGFVGGIEFATPSAGVSVPLVASLSSGLPTVRDGNRPVYGYGFSGQGLTGTIAKAPLVVTGAMVADRTVNGSTAAQVTSWSLAGIMPGDAVNVSAGNAKFIDSSAGIGKAVVATARALGGVDASNYTLAQPAVNTTGNLLPLGGPEQQPERWPPILVQAPETPGNEVVLVLPALTESGPGPLDYVSLTHWQLSNELRARSMAMARLFRTTSDALTADPTLARLPECGDVAGALEGSCIVTKQVKELLVKLWQERSRWADLIGTWTAPEAFELALWPRVVDSNRSPGSAEDKSTTDTGSLGNFGFFPVLGGKPSQSSSPQSSLNPSSGATTLPEIVSVADYQVTFRPQQSGPDPGSTVSKAPVCVTAQQQQSGECQRHAELEKLGENLKNCERLVRDLQSECLFSARVKSMLRRREQEARVLSIALQSREARHAQLPGIGRKWALVIGVGHYPKIVPSSGQPARLPAAEHDAHAMARELSGGLGYITSELINPSRAQVVQRLNMLAAIAQPGDSLLVFFSGYGFKFGQGEHGIWALADADPKDASTMLLHSDLEKMLKLIDARQLALVSDSPLAGQLRVKAVDYNPKAAPDAYGLLGRRATVALTSGASLPVGSLAGQGKSEFATQLLGVLQRVKTWHIGSRIFQEVFAPLQQAGRPYLPQYGAALEAQHQQQADYIFERRELAPNAEARP